uniref:Tetraspanin n=1 Tax=Trichobilharzia regenti TaxID=157069 RepID=A0AA85J6N0_TRIRE|nr:unnamed protein product [Trichobilharzia regenti]
MPRSKVRYAFKVLNVITGIICFAVLLLGGILLWSKVSVNIMQPRLMKLRIQINFNSAPLRNGLKYTVRNLLNPVFFPAIITSACYVCLCVYGYFISFNRSVTFFLIYEVLFSVCVIVHFSMLVAFLRDSTSIVKHVERDLEKLVNAYVSLSSMKPDSLFLGYIMIHLQCCGFRDEYDFYDSTHFAYEDVYDGVKYENVFLPVPCCKMNSTYQLLNPHCPIGNLTSIHQYTKGCRQPFSSTFVRYVVYFAYSSTLVIILGDYDFKSLHNCFCNQT